MLRVRLLGGMEVELEGAGISSRPGQRPWGVLAYLAVATRSVSRTELVSCFWPDVLDSSARASLRSALWALRRDLGEWVIADGDRVRLSEEGLWVDVREFHRLAEAGDAEGALALCRGVLLDGVDDEWVLLARERQREQEIALLEMLAGECEAHDDHGRALEWTRRQAQRDPLDEEVARRVMRREAAAGHRAAALRTYRALSDRLRRELGVAPSPATRSLADELAAAPSEAQPAVRRRALAPIVGRERELGQLLGAWGRVAGGAGTVVVVRGEAGIGKTRTVAELREHVRGAGAVSAAGAALDLGGAAPLSLWAELIRELLDNLGTPPPDEPWYAELAPLAGAAPVADGTPVAPDLQRARLFEGVVALVMWAARTRPLLLVLEDVHGADRPSLELAGYLARRIAAVPVMLLLTRRELPRSAAADQLELAVRGRGALGLELSLAALPRDRVAAIARGVHGVVPAQAELVADRAEGNPLLALESARALAAGIADVAPGLRGSVRATLLSLEGDVRRLVELAAIAARPIEPGELDRLGLDDPGAGAEAGLDTGLLDAYGHSIGFRHALLREAAYAEIADPRRRGLHHRWAEALLADEHDGGPGRPAEVARHLRLAGRDRDAVDELARAAARARLIGALDEAAEYLREATTIAPARADLLLELGEVEAWRDVRPSAEDAFSAAEALLAGDTPLARARALLYRVRAYHGPICLPRAVSTHARAALDLLDGAGETAVPERREALAAVAWAEAVDGRLEEAERLLAEFGDASTGSDLETYDLSHAYAYVLMRRGRFEESCAASRLAAEAVERLCRPDMAYGCWSSAAGAAAAGGDHQRALSLLDRGLEGLVGKGLLSIEVHMHSARSFILLRLGRREEARAASMAGLALAERLARPDLGAMSRYDLGLVALDEEDYGEAAALLVGALAEAAPISRPVARLALAEALARDGDAARATEELRAAVLEPVRPSDFPEALVPRLTRVQGLIAAASGDRRLALRRLTEARAGWDRLQAGSGGSENMATVLADLGRPVVGLVEPGRELARVSAELAGLEANSEEGHADAVIP